MRRLRRIVLSFLAGIVLLVVSVSLYLFVFGGLEQVLNRQLRQLAGPRNNLELYVGKISGDFFSGIKLENVTVHYIDSSTQYLIAEIPRLEVAYSIRNLWNKNYILSYLHLESAALILKKDSEGRWLLPVLSSPDQSEPSGVLPPFAAEKLLVTDLSVRVVRQNDTLAFENVNLSAAVRAEAGTYAVSLDRFEFESNEERIVLDAAEGKLTYADKKLIFQDLLIVSDEMRIRFGGHLNLQGKPTGEIEFSGDNVDLEDIAAYIGPRLKGVLDANGTVSFEGSKLSGHVDLGGRFMIAGIENLLVDFRFEDKQLYLDTLYGTILGNCTIDGSGQIDFTNKPEQYRLNASIKNFNLKQLVSHTFHSDLTGSLALRGESFGKKTMVLNVQTELYESSFDEYPMHYAIGNIIITTDSLVFVDSFRVDYFENIFFVDGPIVYRDSLDLDIRVYLDQLDRYTEKVFIDKPAGRAYSRARLNGKTNDPDLSGYFVSDSLWIYGLYCDSFYATFDLERFLTGRRGEVEADFFHGNAWELPYDTGYLHLGIDSNLVTFDSTFLMGRNSFLSALGVLDTKAYPQQLRSDSLTLIVFGQPFANRGPVTIEIDSAGFDFCDFTIGSNGAQLSALGRVDYDESMDLAVSVVHVQAAPWINLFEKEWSLDGIVSCEAMLRGNFMKPEFTASGLVDSLVYRGLVLGDLATLVDYKDRLLTIDSLRISSEAGAYRAEGSLYADLAFTTDSIQRLPDQPMDIRMEATDTRFDLVTLILPSVEQLEGDFSADVRLSGTPYEPHLEGGAFIRKARLKYFDLEEPVFADSAAVSMQDNRIIIDDVDVFISDRHERYAEASRDPGHNRHAGLSGEIEVRGFNDLFYDIDVTMPEEVSFTYELDDIKGVVSGLLHIGGETPPLVAGDIDVASMKYEVNFAEVDEGSPLMVALSGEGVWDLNLNFDITNNYWIKNEDIDAEFSGQVNLIRENGQYRFIGEMEILRGRGFLFDKTFRLEPGGLVILEGHEVLNPRLDIVGYTRMTLQTSSLDNEEDKSYEQRIVGVHITGTLENPEINPSEDSEIQNREELIAWLVGGYYASADGIATGGVEGRLTGLVSSQMSQIGTRQLGRLGVETFEIDPYYEGAIDLSKTRVTVGMYTFQNLYIYGRSALSRERAREVGLEYRLSKNVLLEGRRDEEEQYRLLLKLHWEFE